MKALVVKHLNALGSRLEVWDDRQIEAGDPWFDKIITDFHGKERDPNYERVSPAKVT